MTLGTVRRTSSATTHAVSVPGTSRTYCGARLGKRLVFGASQGLAKVRCRRCRAEVKADTQG